LRGEIGVRVDAQQLRGILSLLGAVLQQQTAPETR
jgi:hypothetical protein